MNDTKTVEHSENEWMKLELNHSIRTEIKICPGYCFTCHNMSLMSHISFVFNFTGRTLIVKVTMYKMVIFFSQELHSTGMFTARTLYGPRYRSRGGAFVSLSADKAEHPLGWVLCPCSCSPPGHNGMSQAECAWCQLCTDLHVWLHSNLKGGILLRFFFFLLLCVSSHYWEKGMHPI